MKPKGSICSSKLKNSHSACVSHKLSIRELSPYLCLKNLWKPSHKPARSPALPFQYPHKEGRFCPSFSSIDCEEKSTLSLFLKLRIFQPVLTPLLKILTIRSIHNQILYLYCLLSAGGQPSKLRELCGILRASALSFNNSIINIWKKVKAFKTWLSSKAAIVYKSTSKMASLRWLPPRWLPPRWWSLT